MGAFFQQTVIKEKSPRYQQRCLQSSTRTLSVSCLVNNKAFLLSTGRALRISLGESQMFPHDFHGSLDRQQSSFSPECRPAASVDTKKKPDVVVSWVPGTQGSNHKWKDFTHVLVLGGLPAVCFLKAPHMVEGDCDVNQQPRTRKLELDIRFKSLSWGSSVDGRSIPSSGQQLVEEVENTIVPLRVAFELQSAAV